MNKLIVETYFVDFEDYDMFERTLLPLKDKGIGIELHIFDDEEFNNRARAQRERFASYYTTFHGPHRGVEAASAPGSDEQKKMIHAWTEAFKIYKEFGAHCIVLHTNQLCFRPQEKEVLQKYSIDTMNTILDIAREQDIEVLVENVGWKNRDCLLFEEDEFIALFDKLRPNAGCLIDAGHAFINRWDMEKVIRALAPKIKAYHLHNNDGEVDSHRPVFEEGLIYSEEDYEKLLKVMEKYTPDADWILEYAPSETITPEVVIRDCEKLYALLDEGKLK